MAAVMLKPEKYIPFNYIVLITEVYSGSKYGKSIEAFI